MIYAVLSNTLSPHPEAVSEVVIMLVFYFPSMFWRGEEERGKGKGCITCPFSGRQVVEQ